MNSLNGFIKLHRKLIAWGWYQDYVVKCLFLHLLLTANFKRTNWRDRVLDEGQVVTGTQKLADELGFTRQQIRTAIYKLKSTNEITTEITNRFTIVTIVNWREYQSDDKNINQQINQISNQQITNKQPTDNQQITNKQPQRKNIENDKNIKNDKNLSLTRTRAREKARELESRFNFFKVKNFTKLIAAVEQNVNLDFARLVEKSEASYFLTGRNGKRNTDFSVEWLVCHSEDILSGAYDNPVEVRAPKSKSDASYDIDELEKIK